MSPIGEISTTKADTAEDMAGAVNAIPDQFRALCFAPGATKKII